MIPQSNAGNSISASCSKHSAHSRRQASPRSACCPGEEMRRIIEALHGAAAEFPALALHSAFFEQAGRTPDAVALHCGERQITYAALARRVTTLAGRIAASGGAAGAPVGLYLDRCVESVAGILAILSSGCPYVPLSPAHPFAWSREMATQAKVEAILTTAALAPLWAGAQIPVIELDSGGAPVVLTVVSPDAVAPAYLLPTSGSTGRPKLVAGSHRAIMNRLAWMWSHAPYADDEICCHRASLQFVDSVCEIFSPLLRGVPLVILSEEEGRDIERLVNVLAAAEVSRVVVTPSLLRILVQTASRLQTRLGVLRLWTSSGEALDAGTVAAFFTALPQARLLNVYGSAEIAADVSWQEVRPPCEQDPPIGRPIPNATLYLMSGDLTPVPFGADGELLCAR